MAKAEQTKVKATTLPDILGVMKEETGSLREKGKQVLAASPEKRARALSEFGTLAYEQLEKYVVLESGTNPYSEDPLEITGNLRHRTLLIQRDRSVVLGQIMQQVVWFEQSGISREEIAAGGISIWVVERPEDIDQRAYGDVVVLGIEKPDDFETPRMLFSQFGGDIPPAPIDFDNKGKPKYDNDEQSIGMNFGLRLEKLSGVTADQLNTSAWLTQTRRVTADALPSALEEDFPVDVVHAAYACVESICGGWTVPDPTENPRADELESFRRAQARVAAVQRFLNALDVNSDAFILAREETAEVRRKELEAQLAKETILTTQLPVSNPETITSVTAESAATVEEETKKRPDILPDNVIDQLIETVVTGEPGVSLDTRRKLREVASAFAKDQVFAISGTVSVKTKGTPIPIVREVINMTSNTRLSQPLSKKGAEAEIRGASLQVVINGPVVWLHGQTIRGLTDLEQKHAIMALEKYTGLRKKKILDLLLEISRKRFKPQTAAQNGEPKSGRRAAPAKAKTRSNGENGQTPSRPDSTITASEDKTPTTEARITRATVRLVSYLKGEPRNEVLRKWRIGGKISNPTEPTDYTREYEHPFTNLYPESLVHDILIHGITQERLVEMLAGVRERFIVETERVAAQAQEAVDAITRDAIRQRRPIFDALVQKSLLPFIEYGLGQRAAELKQEKRANISFLQSMNFYGETDTFVVSQADNWAFRYRDDANAEYQASLKRRIAQGDTRAQILLEIIQTPDAFEKLRTDQRLRVKHADGEKEYTRKDVDTLIAPYILNNTRLVHGLLIELTRIATTSAKLHTGTNRDILDAQLQFPIKLLSFEQAVALLQPSDTANSYAVAQRLLDAVTEIAARKTLEDDIMREFAPFMIRPRAVRIATQIRALCTPMKLQREQIDRITAAFPVEHQEQHETPGQTKITIVPIAYRKSQGETEEGPQEGELFDYMQQGNLQLAERPIFPTNSYDIPPLLPESIAKQILDNGLSEAGFQELINRTREQAFQSVTSMQQKAQEIADKIFTYSQGLEASGRRRVIAQPVFIERGLIPLVKAALRERVSGSETISVGSTYDMFPVGEALNMQIYTKLLAGEEVNDRELREGIMADLIRQLADRDADYGMFGEDIVLGLAEVVKRMGDAQMIQALQNRPTAELLVEINANIKPVSTELSQVQQALAPNARKRLSGKEKNEKKKRQAELAAKMKDFGRIRNLISERNEADPIRANLFYLVQTIVGGDFIEKAHYSGGTNSSAYKRALQRSEWLNSLGFNFPKPNPADYENTSKPENAFDIDIRISNVILFKP